MADYIYTMEIRLTPDQQRGVTLLQDIARAAGMNIYLTGGAVRDIISGFPIRDLDFSSRQSPQAGKRTSSGRSQDRRDRQELKPSPGTTGKRARRNHHGPH